MLSSLSCSLAVQGERWVEVITIQQSKCSISQLVLFQFDWYHNYLYPLLIIFFCNVLFLSFPTRSETNQQKVLIILSGVVIYYTLFITVRLNRWRYWYTISKVKLSILKIWLLWFNPSHWFLYLFLVYLFCVWIYFQHKKSETRQ